MGIFKKRAADREEMARLTSELQSMASRLDEVDAEKRRLAERLDTLATDVDLRHEQPGAAAHTGASQADLDVVHGRLVHAVQRLDAIESAPTGAVLDELREQLLKLDRRIDEQVALHAESSPGVDAAAISGLRERLDAVDARLDGLASPGLDPDAFDALCRRLDDLAHRFDIPLSTPPETPPPPPLTTAPEPPADTASNDDDGVSGAEVQLAELRDLRRRVVGFGDRLDGVETRLVSISRELALQIDEITGELERASGDRDDAQLHELLDELRDAQSNLAAEQARYQIAFRADLAELADRVRQH